MAVGLLTAATVLGVIAIVLLLISGDGLPAVGGIVVVLAVAWVAVTVRRRE